MILIVQSYPIKKHIMFNHIYGMPEILNEHYYLSVMKFLLQGLPVVRICLCILNILSLSMKFELIQNVNVTVAILRISHTDYRHRML